MVKCSKVFQRVVSDGQAWKGDVKARLYARVRERGYDSLTAFAEARPTVSLVALADELGGGIAAVQVFSGLVAEAERTREITRLVRGQFVREISQHLPNGWPTVLDDANLFEVAHALASWTAYTPETQRIAAVLWESLAHLLSAEGGLTVDEASGLIDRLASLSGTAVESDEREGVRRCCEEAERLGFVCTFTE